MKKVLSLVLVIAMVLSSFSFAFAANFEDVEGDYEDAINTLVALGVVTGYEDGTFKPERVVTRAEMAKLIVEILGYGDLVAGSKSNFADTQGHWADPWIALAAGRGLVIGTGDGKFTPDRTVSYDEAITMIVRALGYSDNSNELAGMTWPTNFKVKAAELKLTKDVALNAAGADRGGVAQLLYNALEATLVTVDSDGNVIKTQDSDKEDVLLLSRLASYDKGFNVTTATVDPKNKKYAAELVDLEPYMFQNLKVYLNDDDQVVYVKGTNSLVVEGTVDKVTADKGEVVVAIEDANEKIQKVTFTAADVDTNVAAQIFENGAIKVGNKSYKQLEDTETIKIVANDVNGNGRIDGTASGDKAEVLGIVTTQQTKAARIEKEYVEGKDKIDIFLLPVDSSGDVDLDAVKVTGAVDSLEDIKEDDVVVEYKADDDSVTRLVVSRDTVEGKVTRVDGNNFYIDGTKYTLGLAPYGIVADDLALGDEGVFYLDHNGDIVDFDGDSQSPTAYAVVIGTAKGTTTTKFSSTSIDDYPQIKLATQDDETIVFDVYAKLNSKGELTGAVKLDGKALTDSDLFSADGKGSITGIGDKILVKYGLNSDGRVNKIEIVDTTPTPDGGIDTTKSSFKLASDAIVFDEDDDYAVVNPDRLKNDINGRIVYNKNGQIQVIITEDVKAGSVAVYAYISKINPAYNNAGDEVQAVVAFMEGAKNDPVYTDDVGVVDDGANKVYALDLDGEVITEANVVTAAAVKATDISARTGMIKTAATGWLPLAENATIVGVKGTTVNLRDLYDIEVDETNIQVYVDDGEVVFIVIQEEDAETPVDPVDPEDPEEITATYEKRNLFGADVLYIYLSDNSELDNVVMVTVNGIDYDTHKVIEDKDVISLNFGTVVEIETVTVTMASGDTVVAETK